MASILGLLEVRESAARERVEDLREAAARAAAALEAAEIELDRRVIAREELVEALAASAAGTTALTEAETEAESVPASVPLPGTTVPSWREGLPATALSPDYQRILGMLADRPGREPVKAKEIAVMLGLEPTPAKVEGVRSKARRLAERGWLVHEASGMFSAGRGPVAGPGGGSSA
ncbi:hypothetical protein [Streptomyces sp. NBC_00439]|uniref:hypothetical protein n=1 Tax=Streptomyces sp. NBC_00439 TaxID=2903650 RepID=UPI002258D0B0|nr:hypothetical protein [Streptomyces sp. NBC_00439]MCX5098062.1 hypothetical protein [Streptomyces sp. NBC_00439]